MKKIGILGGTFNPIHKGHLRIAEIVLKEFDLDKIVFVPSGLPPHKTHQDLAAKEDRLCMIKLAIQGNPHFSISKIELNRAGYSYAVDTFNELKDEFGAAAGLYYIMGMDSINDILSWKKPLELFRLCQFIVATRPGTKVRTFRRLMKFPPLKDNMKKIHLIETSFDISSTKIRKKLKNEKSVDRMLPKKILQYIKKKGLYK